MARIVIADDHALVRAGLRRIMEATGHVVVGEVGDGLEVVPVVQELRPDVLVLDLGLPGLHGLDVIKDVLRRAPEVRVLVVSGFDRDDFVITAFRHGAVGYVLKSAGTPELLQALDLVAHGGYYVSPQGLRRYLPRESAAKRAPRAIPTSNSRRASVRSSTSWRKG
jgi:DNA-binding NarL/FixJ family response regulator